MIPEYLKRNLDLFRTGEYTIVSEQNGVMNARALAAFLNMEIDGIVLETAYRNDWKLRNEPYSPTAMRAANSATEAAAYKEWKENIVILELDSKEISFFHEKIQLDIEGNGKKVFKLLAAR